MKFTETSYLSGKEILAFPNHYEALAVTVSDTGITANADGKKIVSKGTVVGGAAGSVLADPTQMVVAKNSDGTTGQAGAAVDAEGVLLNDADVTFGPAACAMLLHGFVDLNKLPQVPHANAVKALPLIKFIK